MFAVVCRFLPVFPVVVGLFLLDTVQRGVHLLHLHILTAEALLVLSELGEVPPAVLPVLDEFLVLFQKIMDARKGFLFQARQRAEAATGLLEWDEGLRRAGAVWAPVPALGPVTALLGGLLLPERPAAGAAARKQAALPPRRALRRTC